MEDIRRRTGYSESKSLRITIAKRKSKCSAVNSLLLPDQFTVYERGDVTMAPHIGTLVSLTEIAACQRPYDNMFVLRLINNTSLKIDSTLLKTHSRYGNWILVNFGRSHFFVRCDQSHSVVIASRCSLGKCPHSRHCAFFANVYDPLQGE